MRDSRSISEAGRTSGMSFADVRSSAMDRASRILIVSDWPSTNSQALDLCSHAHARDLTTWRRTLCRNFAGKGSGNRRTDGKSR